MGAPRAVLFDLDGTLVDSAPGIEAICRRALREVLPVQALPPLRPFIGPPIGRVLRAALPTLTDAELAAVVARFRVHYDRDGWQTALPYPGATEVLEALAARSIPAFVVTNKPATPTAAILAGLGWAPLIGAAYSPDSVAPPYADKAAAVAHLCERHRVDPAGAWLVGDAEDDRLAARAHGIRFVPALYGYGRVEPGPGEALALRTPTDLLGHLAAAPAPEEAP